MPPMPTSPDNPGRPPPNIPIPGEPTAGDDERTRKYKCSMCGKVFNSKEELKGHIETVHASEEKSKVVTCLFYHLCW